MEKSLHLKSIKNCSLPTALRIAHEAGFTGVELADYMLTDYLAAGYTVDDIKELLKEYQIKVVSINDVLGVERMAAAERKRACEQMELFARTAQKLGCGTIQVCPLCDLEGLPRKQIIANTAYNIRRLADIAAEYEVRLQIETVAWSPINSLRLGNELIVEADRDNLGITVDFWHLWAAGNTTPDELAKFDVKRMGNVHFCDGLRPEQGKPWDENVQRGVMPGEGKIPLQEWTDAVLSSGFDGAWSYELISTKHWVCDSVKIAHALYQGMSRYLEK